MASDMVERVERALLGVRLFDDVPEQHLAPLINEAARAAIEAMREPTEAMAQAGNDAREPTAGIGPNTVATWQAMIDAALQESSHVR